MEKALVVKQGEIVNIEDQAMSIDSLLGQVKLIQDVMDKVMKKDEHYGTIPGTKKPSLYKPGAEKLCLTFRLNPDYDIIREVRDKDFIAYTVKCNLTHIPTGQSIASGIGSCNSRELKYRYRFIEESTGVPVPKKYWEAKNDGDSKEMKRCLQIPNHEAENLRAAKIDGQWVIAKSEKVENDNPWDLDNTLIKMSCKRGLVAAILNATAASDIFTQDTEDLPKDIIGNDKGKKSSSGRQTSTTTQDSKTGNDRAGQKKDKLTEAFLRSVEELQKELVMSLGETKAAKTIDNALNKYQAKSFEDIKKSEHGVFINYLGNLKEKG